MRQLIKINTNSFSDLHNNIRRNNKGIKTKPDPGLSARRGLDIR